MFFQGVELLEIPRVLMILGILFGLLVELIEQTKKKILVRVVNCTVRSLQETIGPFIGSGRLYTPVLDQVGYTPRKKKD